MKTLRLIRLTSTLAAAFGAFLSAMPAGAQQQPQAQLERVEITGSNIRRVAAETAAPVQIISRDQIERTGKTNIAEVLQGITANNSGSIPGSFTAGFASGAAAVSLRGLGVNSTLVLINGRRMANYGLADDGQRSFVDLNSIPLDLVDRIEVLKDGASAIYGSDAIAGVVNVILRRNFEGLAISANAGTSGENDGRTTRFTATGGKGQIDLDGYNVFGSLEWAHTDAIDQSSRRSYLGTNKLDTLPDTFGYYDQRIGGISPISGLPLRNSPFGAVRNPVGNVFQPATPCPEVSAVTGLCVTDNIKYFQLQPEVDRLNLFGRGEMLINAQANGYVEAGIFNTQTKSRSSPSALTGVWGNLRDNTAVNTGTTTLPANHPDNPFGAPAVFRGNAESIGTRNGELDNQSLRFIAGVKGEAYGWDFDTALGRVQSTLDESRTGYLRQSVLAEGIASGQFRLGFTPMDPDYVARLSPTLSRTVKSSVTFADLKTSRELMALQGGAMGLALGAEVRQEKTDTPGLPFTFEGDIVGLGFAGYKATREVYAAYGEINAPVLRDLELSAALRHDRYSDYGGSTTPKLGLKYRPVEQLLLRGTYAEGFRAPGPAENGTSSSAGFAGFLNVTSGNPDIKPETSKSFTLGLVFEPIRDTSLTLDAYRVERRNEITGADATLVIGEGQDTGVPSSEVPGKLPGSKIVYGIDGEVVAIFAPYINGGRSTTTGLDIELKQRVALADFGRLTGTLNWTHIKSFKREIGGVEFEFAGTHGPYVLSSAAGTPRNRIVFDLGWDYADVNATIRANYVGSMKAVNHSGAPYDPVEVGELGPGGVPDGATIACGSYFPNGQAAPSADCKVPSFATIDVFGRWAFSKQLSFSASITNLFDNLAPWDPYTYGGVNYNPGYHQDGAVGRFFRVGAKYVF